MSKVMQPEEMQVDESNVANCQARPEQFRRTLRNSRTISAKGLEPHTGTDENIHSSIKSPSSQRRKKRSDGSADLSANIETPPGDQSRVFERTKVQELSEVVTKHHSSSHSNTETGNSRAGQKPVPPRLPRHNRSHSNETSSTKFIPSPLPSPITATANSFTALSLGSSQPMVSGHNLSRITVPRERTKSRPYSISSAESLLAQECARDNMDEDPHLNPSGRLSDPETSSRRSRHGVSRQTEKGHSKTASAPLAPSTTITNKASEIKSPNLKPALQFRVNLHNLVSTGYLPVDTLVMFRDHSAKVTPKGTLVPQIKEPNGASLYPWLQNEYETPSAWATAVVKGARTGKVAVNGWSAIKVPIYQLPEISKTLEGQGLTEVTLDVLRKRFLADAADDGSAHPGSDSNKPASGQGTLVLDRKKRKRHVAASVDTAVLDISTRTNTTADPNQKGKSTATRPRKRTMSDLSGIVYSDLIEDHQLHLEAAGALFSMQDPLKSPSSGSFIRRGSLSHGSRPRSTRYKHSVILESLVRRRQELKLRSSYTFEVHPSALQLVKALVEPSIDAASTATTDENLCSFCGIQGQLTERQHCSTIGRSSPDTGGAETIDQNNQSTIHRCGDCAGVFHRDCSTFTKPISQISSNFTDESWRCPQCTVCVHCKKSVHTLPALQVVKNEMDRKLAAATDYPTHIQVLSCDMCHTPIHLECQLMIEPALKDLRQSHFPTEKVEWTCLECRECVECGYRAKTETKTKPSDMKNASTIKDREVNKIQGRWSHGSALCPSCTILAEKGNVCPLCCRLYSDDDYETPMIFCDGCSLWVHVACDKGLQDRDYEELGEDSRQYFCPSCIPTPIPSPTHSSSSSMVSAANSIEQSPWQRSRSFESYPTDGPCDHSRETSSSIEEDWCHRSRKRKDDIFDLIKAAKEISDSESRANSPYSAYSPVFPPTHSHSRTLSTSLDSVVEVAEVAAAEALLTIFSGTNTPINSTPHTSYPPSPYEPSFNGPYDRHYSIMQSPQDPQPLMRSMAFTPPSSFDQDTSSLTIAWECQGSAANCRCRRHRDNSINPEDYFNSRPYRPLTIPYHQIGQELRALESEKDPSLVPLARSPATIASDDITMEGEVSVVEVPVMEGMTSATMPEQRNTENAINNFLKAQQSKKNGAISQFLQASSEIMAENSAE
ncbi:hypothetical protein BX616_005224 [Lobosporangium transversale]|uniref:PHD-type domain-containing protein n=1 Tax=Lobosporangium transversale TaxID=64571 RepID=A0A1Y2GLE2_9FUNG|nr:hypothetical protein BCR41DRAFT_100473 [Lobosporangium transversale]KAF9915851.1 hypothetical protein BX616_005224 [Lobosporangium transversale]ORZ12475.1 hypothetical protein BCR41DRAFT_100473 [Lobosporangium transversale]|eukprot:XP_021880094.1 hypothetical protein BCR41DRAFT_100473 [Lobosporangium transversale]